MFGAESAWMVDHFTGFFPRSMWTPEFTWMARGSSSADAFYDWQVYAGHFATRLGRMRLGIGVTEPVRRHPVLLAQAALTLSHLTRHAPILGIGSGEAENITPYGLNFDRPVSRLEEALQVIRLCFDADGPIDFEGTFYNLDGAVFDLKAGKAGTPRLWVAAHGPRMLRLTGRFADGWYPALPMAPDDYARSLARVKASAVDWGRDPSAIVPSMQVFYLVGRNEADVERQVSHPAVRYLGLLAPDYMWQARGLTHPFGEGFGGMTEIIPTAYSRAEVESAIERVPASVVASNLIAGTPDQVVAALRELGEAGLRHAVLSPVSPIVSRRAAAYAFRTMPGIIRKLRSGEG